MGSYIIYDQEWLSQTLEEPIPGIKQTWFANGTNFVFSDGVMINDTSFNITVNEGEVVYLDFRAIINGYNEIGFGSIQFYVWFDGGPVRSTPIPIYS